LSLGASGRLDIGRRRSPGLSCRPSEVGWDSRWLCDGARIQPRGWQRDLFPRASSPL